jgi:hypothetical protein
MLLIEAIRFWSELSSQAHTWTRLVCREVERIGEVVLSAFGLTDLPPCRSGRLNIEGMGELLAALPMGQLLLVHAFTGPAERQSKFSREWKGRIYQLRSPHPL